MIASPAGIQKLNAGAADIRTRPDLHNRLDGFRARAQALVLRQGERSDPITFEKPCTVVRLARWSIRQHLILSGS